MSFGQITIGSRPERAGAAVSDGTKVGMALVALWGVLAGLSLLPGALVLSQHEGDAMHLAAMVLRMAEGQWPHVDFMTPIGIFAVAPIAALVALGMGLGQAMIWSQILLGAVLLPAVWRVAVSRFGAGWMGFAFGAIVICTAMAWVHGGTTPAISISMHYNRWAWALAFVIVALVLVPNTRAPAPRFEGAILGLSLAALALIKVTYLVALLPAVVLALSLRQDWRTLGWGVVLGCAVLACVTLAGGAAFWAGYVGDLLSVATGGSRSEPGHALSDILVSPTHLAGTLVGLASVVLLRRAGRETEGLIMLALLPGFVLITWQNYGNDAQWLPVVALALLVLRPAKEGQGIVVAASVALALSAGWMTNMAVSGIRIAATDVSASGPFFPQAEAHADFRLGQARLDRVEAAAPYAPMAQAPEAPEWGAAIPACDLRSGGVRVFQAVAAELEEAGFAGRRLLVADTFQSFWLFGDFPPLQGGAPWYYDGLPGGASAEAIVVPLCPINERARTRLLDAAAAAGWGLSEVYRGTHVAVLGISRG